MPRPLELEEGGLAEKVGFAGREACREETGYSRYITRGFSELVVPTGRLGVLKKTHNLRSTSTLELDEGAAGRCCNVFACIVALRNVETPCF
jgi:hypothetical protein